VCAEEDAPGLVSPLGQNENFRIPEVLELSRRGRWKSNKKNGHHDGICLPNMMRLCSSLYQNVGLVQHVMVQFL